MLRLRRIQGYPKLQIAKIKIGEDFIMEQLFAQYGRIQLQIEGLQVQMQQLQQAKQTILQALQQEEAKQKQPVPVETSVEQHTNPE
jgi:hypothetical protein